MDDTTLLIVNAGSSSVRLALFRQAAAGLELMSGARHEDAVPGPAPIDAFLAGAGVSAPALVAHRFVHGGRLNRPVLIDAGVQAEIERCAALAPLHNPAALAWLDACRRSLGPSLPQVAVFDTAFYSDLPEHASTYGLPLAFARKHGLRRCGFHGIAHEAMWRAWRALRPDLDGGGRIVSLQLGAGCSVTATDRGRAVDTSMGYTPLEGLLMATRCGDIDPGMLIHLQRTGIALDELERMLTREGGLAGISGAGGDLRGLLASTDPQARLAVEVFCYRARKYVGAYIAALGGVDGILFGGGAGEHLPPIRQRILQGLHALGIVLDAGRNQRAVGEAARISAERSRVEVRVQPVDEARVIAGAALDLMRGRIEADAVD